MRLQPFLDPAIATLLALTLRDHTHAVTLRSCLRGPGGRCARRLLDQQRANVTYGTFCRRHYDWAAGHDCRYDWRVRLYHERRSVPYTVRDPAGDGYDHLPDILSGSGISGHGSEHQVVQQLRCGHHLVSDTESLADRDHRRWGDIERRVLEPGRDGRLHRIDVYDVRADSTNHAGSSARDDLHHCGHLSPGALFPAKGRNNS